MPTTPSIAFDIRIGGLVRGGILDEVDVDYDELDRTLDKLGEPEAPAQDLFIFFTAPLKAGQSLGRAYTSNVSRYIIMPIMETAPSSECEATFIYDAKAQNKTLLHELQHVVDYTDAEMMERNEKEMARARSIARTGRVACYGFSAVVSGAFATHAIEAVTATERITDGVAIALITAATFMMRKYISGEEKLHRYYGRTFEKRAYETEKLWHNEARIPDILKIYRIYKGE